MKNQINQPGLLLLLGCLCAYCSICSVAAGVELQLGSFQTNLVLGHEFRAELLVSNVTAETRISEVKVGIAPVGVESQPETIGKVPILQLVLYRGTENYQVRGIRGVHRTWPGLSWLPESTNGLPLGRADLIFKSPGDYDVRFYMRHLTSSVARVRVVAPVGKDHEAWEHLSVETYLDVMNLYSGYDHPSLSYERLSKKGEDLVMFMQKHGESYYGRVMSTNLFRLYVDESSRKPSVPEWLNKCYQASVSRGGNVGVMRGLYENRFNVRTTEYGRAFFKTGKRPE